jgi:hypothetical protein
MCHFASAAEFRIYSCPPQTRTTGLFGDTVSRSLRKGRRCFLSCASCQSPLETTMLPGSAIFTRSETAANTSARLRAAGKSTPGPPPAFVQVTVFEPWRHRPPEGRPRVWPVQRAFGFRRSGRPLRTYLRQPPLLRRSKNADRQLRFCHGCKPGTHREGVINSGAYEPDLIV